MYVGLGLAVIALVAVWFIAPKLGIDTRAKVSLCSLTAGLISSCTAGYMYSELAGMIAIAVSLVAVAILFGYERG